jgi:hypothetical protein
MKPTTLYSKIKAMGITKAVAPGSGTWAFFQALEFGLIWIAPDGSLT